MLTEQQRRERDDRVRESALAHARAGRLEAQERSKMATFMERLHQGWEQLDREVDTIMALEGKRTRLRGQAAGPDRDARTIRELGEMHDPIVVAKARSRGKAEVLALFMPLPFHTADAIAAEAGLRWQARQNGEVRQTLTQPTSGPALELG
jgi:hypothetical protein